VKTNKRVSLVALGAVIVAISAAFPFQTSAQTTAAKSSPGSHSASTAQWSVQVNKVDPGDVDLASSFQIAIYESLLEELSKTKRFKQVFRDGDRSATDVSDLLILKTTVQKYTAGSETRRAVTTVSGTTKLTVLSQLRTRDGQIILERTMNGNVRFFGSNLRATHNLARNVAKAIRQSSLPEPSSSAPVRSAQESTSSAE
jgi:ABC-type uncharacterized transport system auxiliary subunit